MQLKKSTKLTLGAVIFFLGGIAGLYQFTGESILIIEDLRQGAPLVVIPKGAFYMFGAGVGILSMAFASMWGLLKMPPPTKRAEKIFGTIFFGSLFVMFTLPHLIHYPLADELRKMGYTYCAEKSHYWLLNSNIAYVRDPALCVAEK